ncbi:hypothetical protein DMA11_07545 [Marinilabiliaceae bacterium JC017]|nr:hypothetical protein DMA11_07545 [Marinilabiliaceae bacterium JC017]
MKTVLVLTLFLSGLLSACITSSNYLKNHVLKNKDLSETIKLPDHNSAIFVSHVYKNKELGELFWQKENGEIIQLTSSKQHISAIVYLQKENKILFAQSTKKERFPKLLEPFIINGPGPFYDYKIYSLSLNNIENSLEVYIDCARHEVIGDITCMGLLKEESTLLIATQYGVMYTYNTITRKTLYRLMPKGDFWGLKNRETAFYNVTAGKDNAIYFDAVSGYKSDSTSDYIYDTYRYDINTEEVTPITPKDNNPPFLINNEPLKEISK